jgi:hypothetical protein
LISEQLCQWLVVCHNEDVAISLCEVSCLFKWTADGKRFTLYRSVPSFRRSEKSWPCQCNSPSVRAAARWWRGTVTMLPVIRKSQFLFWTSRVSGMFSSVYWKFRLLP